MSKEASFRRTIAAVESDGQGRALFAMACVSLLMLATLLWLGFARVNVYVASDTARVEVDATAHTVQATAGGRVVHVSNVKLGDHVERGAVLLELDSKALDIQFERARAVCEARTQALDAKNLALDAELDVLGKDGRAASAALGAAAARQRTADKLADIAEESSKLADVMHESALLSRRELLKEQEAVNEKQGAAQLLRSEKQLIDADRRVRLSERAMDVAERRVSIADLKGDIAECEGDQRRLAYEIGLRTLRAPVSGSVAELHPITPGEFLPDGVNVAAIVPSGAPRVVAEFVPGPSIGRLHPGQELRVALDAFPWMQYGFVKAVVTGVASEPRNGRIRVEGRVTEALSAARLVHGLEGRAEIVVERSSPWLLVLRAVGQALLEPDGGAPTGPAAPAEQ